MWLLSDPTQILLEAAPGTQAGSMTNAHSVENCIAEFRSCYKFDLTKAATSQTTIDRWQLDSNLPKAQFLNAIALSLAASFSKNAIYFDIFGAFVRKLKNATHGEWPETFWDIFVAFDAGEFHHQEGSDPIETRTRPMIRSILDRER